MNSVHNTVKDTHDERVTVRVYEDGNVVVNKLGVAGGCVNVKATSGYDTLMELCDGVELADDVADDVLDFVKDNTEFFA